MKLDVIGAGFGRTGTRSLQLALDQLGVGPCYHMMEVFGNVEHIPLWAAAARGETPDWDTLFANYRSTVDWPGCAFWRELVEHFPEAKVLLGVRDPARWYESVKETIYRSMSGASAIPHEAMREQLEMARKIVLENTFDGRFEDRDHAIRVFEAHTEAVKEAIPADRLPVYEVGSGWEPLCEFLNVPIPEEDFPHVNTRESFHERIKTIRSQLTPSE